MSKKCIYCKSEICDGRVLDVCDRCGFEVWGEKMFSTILKNMEEADNNGDLCNSNLSLNEPPSEVGNTRISFM